MIRLYRNYMIMLLWFIFMIVYLGGWGTLAVLTFSFVLIFFVLLALRTHE